jgi:1,4-dihydroxy-2-naphthoate octaprenyltransferase
MRSSDRTPLADFVRISSWPSLLTGAFLYVLGAGIVIFRGDLFNWRNFWLGLAMVILLQLSGSYLTTYYTRLQFPRLTRSSNGGVPNDDGTTLSRGTLLLLAVTTLTAGAMITVLLIAAGAITPAVLLVLGLAFVFSFAYAVPPFRLVYSGYGELVMAVLLTNLVPALGYLLQAGEMISLLGILTFPLTALYLAMVLALSLESYYADIKAGKQNLMIRLGWQRGMFLHNLLILAAYLLIGIGMLRGMAWALTWPRLLTLPIGLFQFWQIWQISNGAKTRWKLLRITAIATFAITLYLQAFTLWVG